MRMFPSEAWGKEERLVTKLLISGACAAAVLCMASGALGAIATLSDSNSVAQFDTNAPGSQTGMTGWNVDGINHLYNQWFWYRVGDAVAGNGEHRFNNTNLTEGLSGTTDTNFDGSPDTFTINYAGAGFTAQMSFRLQGGSFGSNTSDMAEQIRIVNTSGTTLPFHFFQYCDFDLNGTIPDTSVSILNANTVQQTDGPFVTSETVVTPAPSHHEVGVWSSTLNKLDDPNGDNLDDSSSLSNANGADYTWAFQWDTNLAPNGTMIISKDKHIAPSPGALALLGLGGLAASRRRR
jgi:hypothetical protein